MFRFSRRIQLYWEVLRESYWFIPALMTIAASGLAFFTVSVDRSLQERGLADTDWGYTGSAEGARQLLSTVAGSMITIAGVIFSIIVVALSLASNQFGPRLLRNFMRDRGNQLVLGTFISTFVFCLLVLRTVRGEDEGVFVPNTSVTVGVLLALASLCVLIYFIHHAALSMHADTVIANVSNELHASIHSLFPDKNHDAERHPVPADESKIFPSDFDQNAQPVIAESRGYLQVIDLMELRRIATECKLMIQLLHRAGHFIVQDEPLARVYPACEAKVQNRIRRTITVGRWPTPTQDVEFAINQLVEIAVRALSPGINDPFTAISCINQLGSALLLLAKKPMPNALHYDEQSELRVISYRVTFEDIADTALRQLRQYGSSSAAVVVRLLEMIATVIEHVDRDQDREALLHHAQSIRRAAERLPEAADRADAEARYQAVLRSAAKRG